MDRKIIIATTALTFFIILVFLLILGKVEIFPWFSTQYSDIMYAAIMAIIAGLAIEYIYRKYSSKTKFSQTTMLMKPKKLLAKLRMPNGEEITITQYERIFGREDFVGIFTGDQFFFIGKEHFKLTRLDDGFYIEDMNTRNGTKVNGEEIKGMGKVKLTEGDAIILAKSFKIIYYKQ